MPDSNAGDRAVGAVSQLSKIGFVEFTTGLVTNVYETIVHASLDQLKAYGDLVATVADTLAKYQDDAIGDTDGKRQRTVDSYVRDVLRIPLADPAPDPVALTPEQKALLSKEFAGQTIDDGEQEQPIDHYLQGSSIALSPLRQFVLDKLRANTKHSYDLIKTMLQLGMQKVVVTDGDIETKLTFHVDAADSTDKNQATTDSRRTGWGVGGSLTGQLGGGVAGKLVGSFLGGTVGGGYTNSKINVTVVNERSAAATNVNIDVIGHVNIRFRTDTFPAVNP